MAFIVAMSKTVYDSGTDCVSFAKGARVQLWARKDGTFVANKDMIFISQLLNEASSARMLLSCLTT